ncbi:hypothetical protein L2735_14070 [Shewanella olleyana]|uniref:hypothetical protein n=1 Tax=Shewanella olleyana TaxID=135626 RepID=UPI002010C669|nr:hypothetical protein [Shewanella olleyana]MCL1067917.1 hypothetical protein [Shewanella olleyana]
MLSHLKLPDGVNEAEGSIDISALQKDLSLTMTTAQQELLANAMLADVRKRRVTKAQINKFLDEDKWRGYLKQRLSDPIYHQWI